MCGTETTIRIVKAASAVRQAIPSSNSRSLREQRRYQQMSTAASYLSVLVLIASIVSLGYQPPIERQVANQGSTADIAVESPSVDQLVAADLAASVAQTANLSVATNASNLSISLNAKGQLSQTDDSILSKPQIVQTSSDHRGVVEYVAVAGDTVAGVAQKFGISPQTVSWANNLTSDALTPGKNLVIPGTDGVVYVVKGGDTIDTIAQKYKADGQRIIAYNDLEVSGVAAGMRLVLPDGQLPENERPGYVAPRVTTSYGSSYSIIYGASSGSVGNRYSYGYCTWYAYNRRAELGRPVGSFWGDAATWASYAAASGYRVDRTPEAGAVMQSAGGWGGYGHVAVVEQVFEDGSIRVSEMNYAGWNVISSRTIPAGQAGAYNYIH